MSFARFHVNNLPFYNSRDFLLPVDTILNKDAGAWLFIKEHSKFNARCLSSSRYASANMRHRAWKVVLGCFMYKCTHVLGSTFWCNSCHKWNSINRSCCMCRILNKIHFWKHPQEHHTLVLNFCCCGVSSRSSHTWLTWALQRQRSIENKVEDMAKHTTLVKTLGRYLAFHLFSSRYWIFQLCSGFCWHTKIEKYHQLV